MQVLHLTATAICGNCRGRLQQGLTVHDVYVRWWHEENGTRFCPSAPVARPVEDTIRPVAHHA